MSLVGTTSPYTRGFRTQTHLEEHFGQHGWECAVPDAAAYQALADEFLGGPRDAATDECIRSTDQARIRSNHHTEEYGVLSADFVILTYMIPEPTVHGRPTNYDYFLDDCAGRRRN